MPLYFLHHYLDQLHLIPIVTPSIKIPHCHWNSLNDSHVVDLIGLACLVHTNFGHVGLFFMIQNFLHYGLYVIHGMYLLHYLPYLHVLDVHWKWWYFWKSDNFLLQSINQSVPTNSINEHKCLQFSALKFLLYLRIDIAFFITLCIGIDVCTCIASKSITVEHKGIQTSWH